MPTYCLHPSTIIHSSHFANIILIVHLDSNPLTHNVKPEARQSEEEELDLNCSQDGPISCLLVWVCFRARLAAMDPDWYNRQTEEDKALLVWLRCREKWQLWEQSGTFQKEQPCISYEIYQKPWTVSTAVDPICYSDCLSAIFLWFAEQVRSRMNSWEDEVEICSKDWEGVLQCSRDIPTADLVHFRVSFQRELMLAKNHSNQMSGEGLVVRIRSR